MAIDNSFLIQKVRSRKDMIVLFGAATVMPYIICDPETFNDQVWIFETEEQIKEFAQPYAEKKIPLRGIRFQNEQFLGFFTSLFALGINELVFVGEGGEQTKIALEGLVRKPDYSKLPPAQRPLTNPELQLTGLYFMQELTRGVPNEQKTDLPSLDEEFSVNLARARYMVPIDLSEGEGSPVDKLKNHQYKMPVIRAKNGDTYQPLFTDVYEFEKFTQKKKMNAIILPFPMLKGLLVKETKGFMLNPNGFHVVMPLQLLEAIEKRFPEEMAKFRKPLTPEEQQARDIAEAKKIAQNGEAAKAAKAQMEAIEKGTSGNS